MSDFKSQAEEQASKAQDLPLFSNFSLKGLREEVKQILDMIGRVDGIFSTYTKHDISHVDKMLNMLDWLIPPTTRDKMTSLDWLMIVLAIYLHDLGMVVTSEEYDKRMDNPLFVEFLRSLEKDQDGRDYLGRIKNIESQEKDKFFYQEFIRKQHASRIKEWITGETSYQWGDALNPVVEKITSFLENLPFRFRTYLADVCESHHKDDLDNLDLYPLCKHFGSNRNETVNVQYSAILLRTTDLLHITQDRTPSIMYKVINISDPKGIDEWKKQRGTFSVHMSTRDYDSTSEESNIIEVSADFDEEKPFFALTEYLAYAEKQIIQSNGWVYKSQMNNDGKEYLFPWKSIKKDIAVEGNIPRPMSFELDRGRLLDLLVGHTIYNDPTVAIRELLQNGIDAVRYQHYIEKKAVVNSKDEPEMGRVLVEWKQNERELIIEDNGIGMDLEIIQSHLMRVGSSFYNTSKFQSECSDYTPISRFGIGILTCFMISDDIEVTTCRKEGGYRIKMSSVQAGYLLKELRSGHGILEGLEPHGTRIKLRIRDSIELKEKNILDIIKYWIILPECKIIYVENGRQQQIGTESLKQIVKNYCIIGKENVEVKSYSYQENGETYELAFAVRKSSIFPENSFHLERFSDFPSVCIEGIRVDNNLPGFSVSTPSRIVAVLSVRGNKRFSTTVSRTSLENDEEYFKVGRICAGLLFKHINEEVIQVSEKPGKPLSQASSVGLRLYNQLSSHSRSKLKENLTDLCSKLPIIVIEKAQHENRNRQAERELISKEDIEKLDSFWTIESSLVDYLGDISRNIGQELSLNDFLWNMVPDLVDKNIDPLIPEAYLFADTIFSTHIISKVKFSRNSKQTLIQLKKKNDSSFNSFMGINKELIKELKVAVYGRYSKMEKTLPPILISQIEGDISEVRGVKTRLAVILNKNSKAVELCSVLTQVMKNFDLVSSTDRDVLIDYLRKIYILLSSQVEVSFDRRLGSKKYSIRMNNDLRGNSRDLYTLTDINNADIIIKDILKGIGIVDLETYIPVDEILNEGEIFEASTYWNSWGSRYDY